MGEDKMYTFWFPVLVLNLDRDYKVHFIKEVVGWVISFLYLLD